jgi:hypothetical protein
MMAPDKSPCPHCNSTEHVYSVYRDGGSTLYCGSRTCDRNVQWPNPYYRRPGSPWPSSVRRRS